MDCDVIKVAARVSLTVAASVAGELESKGPLGKYFDICENDIYFGQKTFEQAESELMRRTVSVLLTKSGLKAQDIDLILSGDLLNQCCATGHSLGEFKIPLLGLYGACSTAAESIGLASLLTGSGVVERAIACTSSHFGASERQFRFPLEYGALRTPTAQRTVTGCGAFLIQRGGNGPFVTSVVPGRIIQSNVTDASDMGTAMAPAAADTLKRFFKGSGHSAKDFDMIMTGDLGEVGLGELRKLVDPHIPGLADKLDDCGMRIYPQGCALAGAGGSGCGCSAVVLAAALLKEIKSSGGKMLFIGTGALLSSSSVLQGLAIPAIAHLVCIEA